MTSVNADIIAAAIARAAQEPTHSAHIDFGADIRVHKASDPIYVEALTAAQSAGFSDAYIDGRSGHLVIPITDQGRRVARDTTDYLLRAADIASLLEIRLMVREHCRRIPRGQELRQRIEETINAWADEDAQAHESALAAARRGQA